MTAEQNYRLLQEIDANRSFILSAYLHNPALLDLAEARIKQLFSPVDVPMGESRQDSGEDPAAMDKQAAGSR